MPTLLVNAAPSSIVRLLDFMCQRDHHALLEADAEVLEAVAVHTVLSFVRYVRAAVRKRRGTCWLPKDFAFDRSCVDAVAYTVSRRVVPRQLMEDGAAPLRRLLLEAVQPAAVVYVPCSGALQPWCDWLGQLLGVAPSDCCCTRVVLQADGVNATTELRFQHGRFSGVDGLEETSDGAKNGEACAYAAAVAGHLDCLRCIKDTGSNLTKATTHGFTAVHAAAFYEHTDCLDFLLRKQTLHHRVTSSALRLAAKMGSVASLGVFHSAGVTLFCGDPLFIREHVAFAAVECNRAQALEFLLGVCRSEHIFTTRNDGHTIGTLAASLGRVELLQVLHRYDSGCLATLSGPHGTVPYVAAWKGQLAALHHLREVGVSVTAASDTFGGLTAAIHAAAQFGSVDCLQFLLDVEEPSVRESDAFGTSVACAACQGRNVESLQLLIQAGCRVITPAPGRPSALQTAVTAGAVDCIRLLASIGADLAAPCSDNESAAFDAVRNRQSAALSLLIEIGGARVLAANANGETPLHAAAERGAVECVAVLVAHGLLDVVDKLGRTAAQVAVVESECDVVRLLCDAGADLDIKDRCGASARTLARGRCRRFVSSPNNKKSTDM